MARLCNLGVGACLQAYRHVLMAEAAPIDDLARQRFVEAYRAYGDAVRAVNQAAGAVLFEGTDAPL